MSVKSSYTGSLSPEYALLGLIELQPDHGYGLYQRLVTDLNQVWHISLSQTYNILNRLESQGYIEGVQEEQEKRPARRQFYLTRSGRRRLQEWMESPSPNSVRAIRVEFTTRLYFTVHRSLEEAHRLIDVQIIETQAGQERLQAALDGLPPQQTFNRLGLELRIRQLSSILDWLAECYTAIADFKAP